ncbi:4'-phosphopantetheinyl transferase superfamily protein [Streptomyces sp. NPDC005435]|uniref:4'-phosphopantetheinyl transferase family protein n=1 Tax=Streptomyces sp. NPDC005435 TaxID=3154464 RepID=UPI0034520846
MIEELLPESVVAVEAFGEPEDADGALYPEERPLVARAVAKRRREFASVRVCARHAMEKLGMPPAPVLTGERGAPLWPAGLTGSMTHCDGYRAAALVRTGEPASLASLGIDGETHAALPDGVLDTIALPAERERHGVLAAARPGTHWDRLLFSAKESVYKAWFPLTRAWLDFSEADIELVPATPGDGARGTFHARLLVAGPEVGGVRLSGFDGRWVIGEGLVLTAVSVPGG